MTPPPPRRKRAPSLLVYCGALALLTAGVLAFVSTRGTGEIRRCGRVFRWPLPYSSIQVGASENRATYLILGDPELQEIFSSRGNSFGWRFGDQMGAMYYMPSTQDPKMSLTAVGEMRTSDFVQLEFRVRECGSTSCAPVANCP